MTAPRIVSLEGILEHPELSDTNRHGAQFEGRLGAVGRALGTTQIGMTLTEVPPGKAAWPRHFHHVNEEVFWILAGEATLRYGEEDHPVREGQLVCIPPGTGIAFQLRNEGTAVLRYMALSGLNATDVFEYPDSGKIGLVTGGNGPMRGPHTRTFFTHTRSQVPYWTDE
ncbi:MAG: cupin domain-containing protein [Pseudomonadota bacterium]